MTTCILKFTYEGVEEMRINRERNVVVITIITAYVLATALWSAGTTSHASLPQLKDKSAPAAAPILSSPADESARLRTNVDYGKLPLSFEANAGQTDAHVKFLSRGAGYTLFLTSTEAVLSLQRNLKADETSPGRDNGWARVA
jgi:hypothetical protein